MYALFDIGGTKTRIAATKDLETFTKPAVIPTPDSFEEGIEAITRTIKEQCGDGPIELAAGGIAASPNTDKTAIVGGGPNIQDWLGKPLKARLEEALDASVRFENDTAMGGLAQVARGPAQGSRVAVYVTVSTGVGGCRFVDGAIDQSVMGFEPGWQIIGAPELNTGDASGWVQGYCSSGYLMSHIGGACVERAEGKKPYEILDKDFWDEKAKILARGLHNICTMWSPEVIVVGGSMMNEIGIPLNAAEKYLKETLTDVFPGQAPRLARAEFGDEMGLYGAMAYIRQL